jgi:class 3 adenylate cyclase
MYVDLSQLTLAEMIRLREEISDEISRRFERKMAVAFSDIVGSTNYFARFGDEAGRALQQRHLDILNEVLPLFGGRIVDTAGDGAFLCFPTVNQAIDAMSEAQRRLVTLNASREPEHHLRVRVGVHFGAVLTDGQVVSGDSVNICAGVASTCEASTITITSAAFEEFMGAGRTRCRLVPPMQLKGTNKHIVLMEYEWREAEPVLVRVVETGAQFRIPNKESVTFGRLAEQNGMPANDIVLTLPDESEARRISRWHFELRHLPDGLAVRPLSDSATEVDGVLVKKGELARIVSGTTVRLASVLTLLFLAENLAPQSIGTILASSQRR